MPTPQTQQYTSNAFQALVQVLQGKAQLNQLRNIINQQLSMNNYQNQTMQGLIGTTLDIAEFMAFAQNQPQQTPYMLPVAAEKMIDIYLASEVTKDPSKRSMLDANMLNGVSVTNNEFMQLTQGIQQMRQRQQMQMGQMQQFGQPQGFGMQGYSNVGRPIRNDGGFQPQQQFGNQGGMMPMGNPVANQPAGSFFTAPADFGGHQQSSSGIGGVITPAAHDLVPRPVNHNKPAPQAAPVEELKIGRPVSTQGATPVQSQPVMSQVPQATFGQLQEVVPMPTADHEIDFMNYKDHATYWLLQPVTAGDIRIAERTTPNPVKLGEGFGAFGEPISEVPFPKPDKPSTDHALEYPDVTLKSDNRVDIGTIRDLDPYSLAQQVDHFLTSRKLYDQLAAQHAAMGSSVMLESLIFSKKQVKPLNGAATHAKVVLILNEMDEYLTDEIHRKLVLDITQFVNTVLSVEFGVTAVRIQSYSTDAEELDGYIQSLQSDALSTAWAALAGRIYKAFMKPEGLGNHKDIYRHTSEEAIADSDCLAKRYGFLWLSISAMSFGISTTSYSANAADVNYIRYAAVRKSAHPGLYRLLSAAIEAHPSEGYFVVVFSDGRMLSVHKPLNAIEELRLIPHLG